MKSLIVLVITFCYIGNTILLGRTKKENSRRDYSSCHDCAIYYYKFFGQNDSVCHHRNYLCGSHYYRVVHWIL